MSAAVCPWCSAALTEGASECPSCGANLVPDGEPNVPGVTAVDAASIIRSKTTPQPRNRLLSWISGEYPNDLPSKAESQAIALPDPDVRREILRLELEAEVASLQAEADALLAEAAAEGRALDHREGPPEAEPMVEGEIVGAPFAAHAEADAPPSDSETEAVAEPEAPAPTPATDDEHDSGKGQPTA